MVAVITTLVAVTIIASVAAIVASMPSLAPAMTATVASMPSIAPAMAAVVGRTTVSVTSATSATAVIRRGWRMFMWMTVPLLGVFCLFGVF